MQKLKPSSSFVLTKRDRAKIAKEVARLRKGGSAAQHPAGDLYKALHFVGDDPVKADIQNALKILLPEEQFLQVVAVFNLATDWRFLLEQSE